ncbi:hypothetical protein SAMN05216267_1001168 [Actinacidiphila rubida]|uniref:Uncharacterized protein n=2 Tax=Actinacidiphila rubida TaxID=310780 RepID=A0A1H8DKV1_9ACTN|nr:hypothetical protein SAMN05216267_1001168 [Actinacidiphila rubida]
MFDTETSHDPLLARSDKLIRLGALVAPVGLCLFAMTSRLWNPTKLEFELVMFSLAGVGQVLVWRGMRGVYLTRGWLSGVVAYVWLGGVLNAWALAFTGSFSLLPAAFVAPLVATVARFRMRRGAKHAGVPE